MRADRRARHVAGLSTGPAIWRPKRRDGRPGGQPVSGAPFAPPLPAVPQAGSRLPAGPARKRSCARAGWPPAHRSRHAGGRAKPAGLDLSLGHIPPLPRRRPLFPDTKLIPSPNGLHCSSPCRPSSRSRCLCGEARDLGQCAGGGVPSGLPRCAPTFAAVRRAVRARSTRGPVCDPSAAGADLQGPSQSFGPVPMRGQECGRQPASMEAVSRQAGVNLGGPGHAR